MPSVISTLHTFDTVYSADSVEWCPHPPHQHLFVCATYQLAEGEESLTSSGTTTRKGRILLFSYDPKCDSLALSQTIETAAILDQKWNPKTSNLAVAAGGELQLYATCGIGQQMLSHVESLEIPPEDEREQLALALDWSSDGSRAAVSDSRGGVSIVSIEQSGMRHLHRWKAHSFEAWTCAFDRADQNVLYTGGDDSLLCTFDIRCPESPVGRLKNKSHGAGVTSLLSFQDHLLATGSYDDCLRIFDTRAMKSCLTEFNVGGGLWRIRPNPARPRQLLCACMYHNFSVVSVGEGGHVVTLDAEYNEHGSICYGCDWSWSDREGCEASYFATCSFYDHKLCLAVLKTEE
uniref:methylated diphthine methylhydrolase n=1 Tax=Culex tarsalis TaxID=7177 RepID=A0A1Q3FFM3_CULTA